MIVEDSTPAGVLVVGRLARGTVSETRRVAHVFTLDAAEAAGELVQTRCGEALTRRDVEWVAPGTGMPCEPCLGLTGSWSPQRELGV